MWRGLRMDKNDDWEYLKMISDISLREKRDRKGR